MAQTFPAATLIQAFELFYTRFILRDFVGKIVPGSIFLFLACSAARRPEEIIQLAKCITFLEGAVLAAVAWLFALCSQSIHSRIFYFYFPRLHQDLKIERLHVGDQVKRPAEDKAMCRYLCDFKEREKVYAREVAEAYHFMREASPDEKAQYERYVVIKEACGNSMFCTLLGLIAYLIVLLSKNPSLLFFNILWENIQNYRAGLIVMSFWVISAGLMKRDNLLRQTCFIEALRERRYLHKRDFLRYADDKRRIEFIYWMLRGSR